MSALELSRQALLVYVFVRVDGPDATAGWLHLQALWESCRRELQMDAAVPGLASTALPGSDADIPTQPGLVAACQRPDDAGVWQAFVRREHDAICLAVMMAPSPPDTADRPEGDDHPPGGDAESWADLEHRWTALQPEPPSSGVLGQALLLLGLAPVGGPAAPASGAGELSGMVRQAVVGAATPGWWQRSAATLHPFTLWEAATSTDDGRPSRRTVALAPEAAQDDLYRWVWTSGDGRLAPFARYLLHAAKLRHQLRVFDDGRSFRRIHTYVDAAVDDLLRLHLTTDPTEISVDQLLHARTRLAGVQTGTTGLVVAATRLREIARTVDIARTNMAALLASTGSSEPPAGLFADDRELALWFTDRIADEQVYLDAARERARDVADVTAAVVGQRLAEYQEGIRRHQDRLTLLQTSILGALLMALGAVQALEYKLRVVPNNAQGPLIVLLAALALALPFWAFRLNPRVHDDAPRGATDNIMIGTVGAAAGWLVVAWVTSNNDIHNRWMFLAAVNGAVLTVAITKLIAIAEQARRDSTH